MRFLRQWPVLYLEDKKASEAACENWTQMHGITQISSLIFKLLLRKSEHLNLTHIQN